MQKDMKNLKVESKLKLSFRSVLIALAVSLLVGVGGMAFINLQLSRFYNEHYKSMTLQLEARRDIQMLNKSVLAASVQDGRNLQKKTVEVQRDAGSLESSILALVDNFGDAALNEELSNAFASMDAEKDKIMQYVSDGDTDAALVVYNDTYNTVATEVQNILVKIGEKAESQANYSYSLSILLGSILSVVMVAVGIVGFMLAMKRSKRITGLLVAPIYELQSAARKMSRGDLDIQISYESQDELGDLAEHFREACQKIHSVIWESGKMLEEMANGNFDTDTGAEESFVGEFKTLLDSMREVNFRLDETLRKIQNTSASVSAGAMQLSDSAQLLAEGATDQAGAVGELTATIENVTGIAQESAQGAVIAAKEAGDSAEEAKKRREGMRELTDAMAKITETSRQIGAIIETIEDIADQTNLLSLNASIEAARAGEAGRGFAVVAEQIGKLASDSAQSAVNSRDLIEKSLMEIERGNRIVEDAMKAFEQMYTGMESFAKMAGGAAEASLSQAEILKQVETGIEQISSVVESNSAASEQTSAIAQELSSHTESLDSMLGQFTLRGM